MITKRDLANIESLFYLSAIHHHAGKRKASEALGISVDTFNKYIDNFENETGYNLLTTNSRGCTLTAEGRAMIKKVDAIKAILDGIYASGKISNPEELKGKVTFCTTIGVNAYFMPHDLSEFFDIYPQIHLVSNSANEASEIQSMDFDVGITYDELPGNDVVVVYSKTVNCGLFASSEYLAKYGYPANVKDLQENHRIINKLNSESYIKPWKEIIKQAKYISYTTNNTFSVVESVKRGVGISMIPMGFTREGLVCLDNIACNSTFTFYLFARRNTKDIPRVRAVIDFYKGLMDRM